MLKRLLSKWFKLKPQVEETACVFFDGDQGFKVAEPLMKKLPNVKYFWVQNSRATIPKKITDAVKKKLINVTIPSDIGKESVDMFIAMKIAHVCSGLNPPRRVYIISQDIDFIDVIINAAKIFTKTDFILMIARQQTQTPPTKHIGAKLPKNASVVFFKPKKG
jgi:hypothetical protein